MMYYGLLVFSTVVAIFVRLLDVKTSSKNCVTAGGLIIATVVSALLGFKSLGGNWHITVVWFLVALIYVVITVSIVLPKNDDTYYDDDSYDDYYEEEKPNRYVPDASYFAKKEEPQQITYVKPQPQKVTQPSAKVTTSDCNGFEIED